MSKFITAQQVIDSRGLCIAASERREDMDKEFGGICYYDDSDMEFIVIDEKSQTVWYLDGRDDMFGEEVHQRPFDYYVK